jgi:hypothetical protein
MLTFTEHTHTHTHSPHVSAIPLVSMAVVSTGSAIRESVKSRVTLTSKGGAGSFLAVCINIYIYVRVRVSVSAFVSVCVCKCLYQNI